MRIGSLGFAGSGKTTLLGALTLELLQGDTTSDLVLFNFEGAETTRDLTQFADHIQRGRWPARTSSSQVREYCLALRRKSTATVFSLRLPELPGELLEETWRTDHIPAPLSFLTGYDGYLVLLDPLVDDPDELAVRTVHLLQGIKRAKGYRRADVAPDPVALVLTKHDALSVEERALEADELAFDLFPLLCDFVRCNFAARRSFLASAVGAVDGAGQPLLRGGRIRSEGIFAPLEWITEAARPPGPEAPA